jgi:hypothetical protein
MKLNIDWKPRKYNTKVYTKVCSLYKNGFSPVEIEKKLDMGSGYSADILDRFKLRRNRSECRCLEWRQHKHRTPYTRGYSVKYHYKENFFKKQTPSTAWVLGLLLSDGHVAHNAWSIAASLDICRKVKKLVGGGKISKCKRANVYYLRITNLFMCDFLRKNFGFSNNKCLKLPTINLPKYLMPHFIRGFWDGDGCITVFRPTGRKKKVFRARVALADRNFVLFLKKYLQGNHVVSGGCFGSAVCKNRFSKKPYYYFALTNQDSLKLCKWMYIGDKNLFGKLNYSKWLLYKKTYPLVGKLIQ